MNRWKWISGGMVVLALVAALLLAIPAFSGAQGDETFASGAGSVTYLGEPGQPDEIVHFSFTAHVSPSGEPDGSVVVRSTLFELGKADVTCFFTLGDAARVGAVLREPSMIGNLRIYAIALQLEDNGPPGKATDYADVWAFIARPGRDGQTPCRFSLPPASRPLDRGNINVGGHQGARARLVG